MAFPQFHSTCDGSCTPSGGDGVFLWRTSTTIQMAELAPADPWCHWFKRKQAEYIHYWFCFLERRVADLKGLLTCWAFGHPCSPTEGPTTLFWTPALSSVSSWATFNHFFFVLVTVLKENYCTFSLFWMDEAVSFRVIGVCIPCQLVISHIKKVLKLITQKAAITFCRHHMYKSTGTSDQVASYYFDTSLPRIKQQKYFFSWKYPHVKLKLLCRYQQLSL